MGDGSFQVFVRIRPIGEDDPNPIEYWTYDDNSIIESSLTGEKSFPFDHCFGPDSTNLEIFRNSLGPLVPKILSGENTTIFTYGQMKSGKSWTLRGNPANPGLIHFTLDALLNSIDLEEASIKTTIKFSCFEVYNEDIKDLLARGNIQSDRSSLRAQQSTLRILSDDFTQGVIISDLTEVSLFSTIFETNTILNKLSSSSNSDRISTSLSELSKILMRADSLRTSQVSDTVYRLLIEKKKISPQKASSEEAFEEEESSDSVLLFVDLAGTDPKESTTPGNLSLTLGSRTLSALTTVVNKLSEGSKKTGKSIFVPFRESKITRILKPSFGGLGRTLVLCTAILSSSSRECTSQTLRFAQACRSIRTSNFNPIHSATQMGGAGSSPDVVPFLSLNSLPFISQKGGEGQRKRASELTDESTLIKSYRKNNNELRQQVKELQIQLEEAKNNQNQQLLKDTEIAKLVAEKKNFEKQIKFLGKSSNRSNDIEGEEDPTEDALLTSQKLEEIVQMSELEEAKVSFEEYELQTRLQLDQERERLQHEREILNSDRAKLLSERSVLHQKEDRLGGLLSTLDERDSKLMLAHFTLKEQMDSWQLSIVELSKREELVREWQQSYSQRESRLAELSAQQEMDFKELLKREEILARGQQTLIESQKELQEKESRLQDFRDSNERKEKDLELNEEKMRLADSEIRRRESECDAREQVLAALKKDFENWDGVLREKERRLQTEQKVLDEREDNMGKVEYSLRLREEALDRSRVEVRNDLVSLEFKQQKLQEMQETFNEQNEKLGLQLLQAQEREHRLVLFERELAEKEERLRTGLQELSTLSEIQPNFLSRVQKQKEIESQFYTSDFKDLIAHLTSQQQQWKELLDRFQALLSSQPSKQESSGSENASSSSQLFSLLFIISDLKAKLREFHAIEAKEGAADTFEKALIASKPKWDQKEVQTIQIPSLWPFHRSLSRLIRLCEGNQITDKFSWPDRDSDEDEGLEVGRNHNEIPDQVERELISSLSSSTQQLIPIQKFHESLSLADSMLSNNFNVLNSQIFEDMKVIGESQTIDSTTNLERQRESPKINSLRSLLSTSTFSTSTSPLLLNKGKNREPSSSMQQPPEFNSSSINQSESEHTPQRIISSFGSKPQRRMFESNQSPIIDRFIIGSSVGASAPPSPPSAYYGSSSPSPSHSDSSIPQSNQSYQKPLLTEKSPNKTSEPSAIKRMMEAAKLLRETKK